MPDVHPLKSGVQVAQGGNDERSRRGKADEDNLGNMGGAVANFKRALDDKGGERDGESPGSGVDYPRLFKESGDNVVEIVGPNGEILGNGDAIGGEGIEAGQDDGVVDQSGERGEGRAQRRLLLLVVRFHHEDNLVEDVNRRPEEENCEQ